MSQERRQNRSHEETEHDPFEPLADEFVRCANQLVNAARSISERFSKPTVFIEFFQSLPSEPVTFDPQAIPKHRDVLTFTLNVPLGLFDTLIDRCLIEAPLYVVRLKEIYSEVITEARHLMSQLNTTIPIDLASWFRFTDTNIPFAARRLHRMATLLRLKPVPLIESQEDTNRQKGYPWDAELTHTGWAKLIPQEAMNADMQSMEGDRVKAHLPEQGKPTPPTDLISSAVAVKDYSVSRATLRRAVAEKRLRDYRPEGHGPNVPLRLSRAEVANIWLKRGQ